MKYCQRILLIVLQLLKTIIFVEDKSVCREEKSRKHTHEKKGKQINKSMNKLCNSSVQPSEYPLIFPFKEGHFPTGWPSVIKGHRQTSVASA